MASNSCTNNLSNTQQNPYTPASGQPQQAISATGATTGSIQAHYLPQYATNTFAPPKTTDSLAGTGGQFVNTGYPPYASWGSGPIGLSSANAWGYNGTGAGSKPDPFWSSRPTNTVSGAGNYVGRNSQQAGQSRRSSGN